MERNEIERALAKVLAGGNGAAQRFIGSAFFVAPRHLLTARHCADAVQHGERLFLKSYTGHGECPAEVVALHPERDIALLRITDPQFDSSGHPLHVPQDAESPEPGAEVTVCGFAADAERADFRSRQVITPSADYDAIRLDHSIALGMSGGPVIAAAGQLVGVLYGRNADTACQYVVPVAAFAAWLDQHVARSQATHQTGWLKGYLESLKRKLSDMPTDLMLRRLSGHNSTLTLRTRHLYVPLHVEARRADHSAASRNAETQSPEPEPLLQALANHPRLVVRGDPGSGKSTFLRYLALRLGGRLQGEPRQADAEEEALPAALDAGLPLFVLLKEFYYSLLAGTGHSSLQRPPTAQAVEAALLQHLAEHHRDLRENGAKLRSLLFNSAEDKAIWLLDGLDEINIPDEERHHLIKGLSDWARDLPPHHAVCLTTRPYAYAGQSIPHFDNRLVQPLAPEQIEAFVGRFCRENGQMFQPGADALRLVRMAEALSALLQDPAREALRRIASNPLLLMLATALYCKGGESALPRDRAELYEVCLEALLQRWEEKLDRSQQAKDYSLHDTTVSHADLHASLDHLGYHAHLGLTQSGVAERENGDLTVDLIAQAFAPRLCTGYSSQQVIDYLQHRTGLIVARDGNAFAFLHRSFREYLAARYLIQTNAIRDLTAVSTACHTDPGWWREVLALAARLGDQQRECPLGTTGLLTFLLPFDPTPLPAAEDQTWPLAELIAHGEAERDADGSIPPERAALRARCVTWLVRLIEENRLAASPAQREQAAITLGRLGDPRPGVGLDPEYPRLPQIDWVDIPPGSVTLEDAGGTFSTFTLDQPFQIARYPVTNRQFQAFIEDPDGYQNRAWWADFEGKKKDETPELSYWPEPNHPRINVSWYEAVAFCRWLTARLRACGRIDSKSEVRLPTECEWQQAATGGDPANIFPWGSDYTSGRANIDERESYELVGPEFLGRTSAVGLYRAGASAQGGYDLAGNVLEWCENKYDSPDEMQADKPDDYRVLRGGAWDDPAFSARAAFRSDGPQSIRGNYIGFRVLCSPPSSGTGH